MSEAGIDLRQKRILEVGCGAGGILAYFREHHDCDVVGCDFGSEGVRYGVENYGLSLQEGDLNAITLEWKPDFIIYSHVFEHILNLNDECEKTRKLLHDEGGVYIEVPSVKNIREAYQWDFLLFLQNAHTFHFTLRTLQNVMQRHGFVLQAGNEFVKSLFVKNSSIGKVENDYDDVMKYLRHTERFRQFGIPKIQACSPRRLLFTLLKKFRLYGVLRKIIGKA